MHPYVKTALWILIGFVLLTHPQIITKVMDSLSVFMANVHAGG